MRASRSDARQHSQTNLRQTPWPGYPASGLRIAQEAASQRGKKATLRLLEPRDRDTHRLAQWINSVSFASLASISINCQVPLRIQERHACPALPCPAFEPARPAVTAPATRQTDAEPAPKGTRPLSPTMMTMQRRVQQPSPVTRSGKPFDETEAPLAPRFLLVSALPRPRHWRNRLGGNAPERLPQRGVSSARAVSRARQRKRFSTSVLCSGLAYQSGFLPFATRWGMGDAGRY